MVTVKSSSLGKTKVLICNDSLTETSIEVSVISNGKKRKEKINLESYQILPKSFPEKRFFAIFEHPQYVYID